jgi:hypothetical protein
MLRLDDTVAGDLLQNITIDLRNDDMLSMTRAGIPPRVPGFSLHQPYHQAEPEHGKAQKAYHEAHVSFDDTIKKLASKVTRRRE